MALVGQGESINKHRKVHGLIPQRGKYAKHGQARPAVDMCDFRTVRHAFYLMHIHEDSVGEVNDGQQELTKNSNRT